MRVLITGGTGLIGGALGQRLVREGFQLRVLIRPGSLHRPSFPCQLYSWDAEAEEIPSDESVFGCDAVIHLAGENIAAERWTPGRKRSLRASRVKAADSLARALRESGVQPKVFISASGVGYFGDRRDERLDDAAPAGSGFMADLCREWESSALRAPGHRHVISRFGVVLSPKSGFLRELAPMFASFGASRLSSGRNWLSWISLDDVVEALVLALKSESLSGPVNFVSPEPVTNAELTRELRRVWKSWPAPPVPRLAMRAAFGELGEALLSSQRCHPGKLLAAGFRFQHPNLSKTLDHFYGQTRSGEILLEYSCWIPGEPGAVRAWSDTHPAHLEYAGRPVEFRHESDYIPLGGGTEVREQVRLKLPLGPIGRFSASQVLRHADQSFLKRRRLIAETFSGPILPR